MTNTNTNETEYPIVVAPCACCGALLPDHMLSDDDRCIECAGEQPE